MRTSLHSSLTEEAISELSNLIKGSRRKLAEFYREHRSGLTLEAIARKSGDQDLRRVRDNLSALHILLGRKKLPKRGEGRQTAVYEAEHWLKSPTILSEEVVEHLESILIQAEKTNTRRSDFYDPPLPPKSYAMKHRPTGGEDYPAVYVLTRQSFLEEAAGGPVKLKLGWSNKVWDRLSSAQTWDPEPIAVLRIFPCKDPNIVEAKLQIVLDTLDLGLDSGGGIEWFEAPLDLIDACAASIGLVNQTPTG